MIKKAPNALKTIYNIKLLFANQKQTKNKPKANPKLTQS